MANQNDNNRALSCFALQHQVAAAAQGSKSRGSHGAPVEGRRVESSECTSRLPVLGTAGLRRASQRPRRRTKRRSSAGAEQLPRSGDGAGGGGLRHAVCKCRRSLGPHQARPDRCPRGGTGFRPSIRAVPARTGVQEAGRAGLEIARPVWLTHRAGFCRWPRCVRRTGQAGFRVGVRRYSNDVALIADYGSRANPQSNARCAG